MKKIIISALVALSAVICFSAKASDSSNNQADSNASVEYLIPGITSGSIKLQHVQKIYCLMPNDIKEKSSAAYRDIINNGRSEFVYGGVKVKHTATTWEFYYKGGAIIVRNASPSELDQFFGYNEEL